ARGNVPAHPGVERTVYGPPVDSRNARADGAHQRRARRARGGWRETGFPQASAEGYQDFALGRTKPHFERIRGPGLGAPQELAFTIRQPRRGPRAAAVDSQKATHRACLSTLAGWIPPELHEAKRAGRQVHTHAIPVPRRPANLRPWWSSRS